MKKINVYLPEPQIAALKSLSKRSEITVSEHIRTAIGEYLGMSKLTGVYTAEDARERIRKLRRENE